jgi:hypothetical protein
MTTFEDWLQDKFIRENPCVLDDDIPDAFSEWIGDSELNDIISWANEWGKDIVSVMNKAHKIVRDRIKEEGR